MRYDICEAYLMLEHDYGEHGWLTARGFRPDGSVKQVSVQLKRMGFRASPLLTTDTLSETGREIYDAFVERLVL